MVFSIFSSKTTQKLESLQDLMQRSTSGHSFGFIGLNNGSGATTLAVNYAALLASEGAKTVLLDGNLMQPNCFYHFKKFEMDPDKSLSRYFKDQITLKDLNQPVPGHNNLFLISAHPTDNPVFLMHEPEHIITLMDSLLETFDYVVADLPYLPHHAIFIYTIQRLDKGLTVWNEGLDCGYLGAQVIEYINMHSNRGSSMNNIVINQYEGSPFDPAKIRSEFKANFVTTIPFISEMRSLKNSGELVINSPYLTNEFKRSLSKIHNLFFGTAEEGKEETQ